MILKAYKYRIYPTFEQEIILSKHFGSTRWVYNYALDKKIKAYQANKKNISIFELQKDLPILKQSEDTCWLKEVNSQSLQASMKNLESAFTGFLRNKMGFPKFKSKHNNKQSFSVPQKTIINFEASTISFPKFKNPIKCIYHRKFNGTQKTVTVSKATTGKYFVSILVEANEDMPKLKTIDENKAIGIDLGIKTFAVISNGEKFDNPKFLKLSIKKIKKLHSKVSKKVNGSNNRKKAINKLALLHEKVANQRNDFLHKLSAKLISEHDTLCLETLSAANMMKNHCISQSIGDASWSTFVRMLEYKAEWKGVNTIKISRFAPSSKMCPCGAINKELKLSIREWTCNSCGEKHDRDLLAANNIKRFAFIKTNTEGIAEIKACGDKGLLLSLNQEI